MNVSPMALVVVLAGLFVSSTGILTWQVLLCLFGATAAITLPGGAVLTPSVLFTPFLIVRGWRERGGSILEVSKPTFTLLSMCAWIVIGAALFPSVFAGKIHVYNFDRLAGANGVALIPLRPVSGNITQTSYALGQFAVFCAVRALLATPERRSALADAVILLGIMNAVAAITSVVAYYAGFPDPISFVRNAYAVFSTYETVGLVRIQGTFSETSTFSSFTLGILAFVATLWYERYRRAWTGPLSLVLLALLLLSTSSTAYIALALFGALAMAAYAITCLSRGKTPNIVPLLLTALVVTSAILGLAVVESDIPARVASFLEQAVVDKIDTASGRERMAWNVQAWNNVLETYGVGVGLGSARASNFFLVLLSNTGVLGLALFSAFLLYCMRGAFSTEPTVKAGAFAVVGTMCAASVSAGVYDLGIAFYLFAAAASLNLPNARRMHANQ